MKETIYSKNVPLGIEARTFVVNFSTDATDSPVHKVETALSCTSAPLALLNEGKSARFDFLVARASTTRAALLDAGAEKAPTFSVEFYKKAPRVATGKIAFERTKVATRKTVFEKLAERSTLGIPIEPLKIESRRSNMMDDRPQHREMIDLRFLDYPRISEYITRLAEEHGLQYTQVQLIGIFAPVPMHLVSGLTLDPVSGKLRFFVRHDADPRAERKFVRVAYARVRSTKGIIQSFFPVI